MGKKGIRILAVVLTVSFIVVAIVVSARARSDGTSGEASDGAAVNGSELPPATRRTTLMAAGPVVVSCFAEAGVSPETLDRRMHSRLNVAPAADGKIRVIGVEIVGGSSAPPEFIECVTRMLPRLELDLEPGTRGVVVTPPFAGPP